MESKSQSIQQKKAHQYENIVFEGGGVKGWAYAGAVEVLEEEGILQDIKRIAGTSAGSMTALLLALGYDSKTSCEMLRDVFIKSGPQIAKMVLTGMTNIGKEYGLNNAQFLHDWAGEVIGNKLRDKNGNPNPDATFRDLYNAGLRDNSIKELYVIGANLSTKYYEIFSYHHKDPDMPLRQAVRISMSIPIAFAAVRYSEPNKEKSSVYVDGGVLNNYPLTIFDKEGMPNPKTLGFRVDSSDEIAILRDGKDPEQKEIKSFGGYLGGLSSTLMNAVNNEIRHSKHYRDRTVFIDIKNVGMLESLSTAQQEMLVTEGKKATKAYLRYLKPKEKETDSARLQRYDREKVYQQADEIYLFPVDEDARIEYVFRGSNLEEVRECYNWLKEQEITKRIALYSGSIDDKLKVIEVTLNRKALEEIQELDNRSNNKKAKEQTQFDNNLLIKMEEWQRPVAQVIMKAVQSSGQSAELCKAARYGKAARIADLLQAGVSPDYKDRDGRTALHYASELGYIKIVELLLNHQPRASVDIQDNMLETPLHIASAEGHIKIVGELIKARANINIQSSYGSTPLHRAKLRHHEGVAQLLINNGASQTIVNGNGKTAAELGPQAEEQREARGVGVPTPMRPRTESYPHSYKELLKQCRKVIPGGVANVQEIAQKLVGMAAIETLQSNATMRPEGVDRVAIGLSFRDEDEMKQFIAQCNANYPGLVVEEAVYTQPLTGLIMDTTTLYNNIESILGVRQKQAEKSNNCLVM